MILLSFRTSRRITWVLLHHHYTLQTSFPLVLSYNPSTPLSVLSSCSPPLLRSVSFWPWWLCVTLWFLNEMETRSYIRPPHQVWHQITTPRPIKTSNYITQLLEPDRYQHFIFTKILWSFPSLETYYLEERKKERLVREQPFIAAKTWVITGTNTI